ncbi:Dyp-type peroxidase [Natronomonas salina]|uniref:DUF7405 family protein n=1 Tax=Natronomonas salina TaxID=1710540 RepID=UPI0015B38C60|nr:Dyp-type peroxidase domain-containing protein [Natronomonas salina]QLD87978.1 Dyp-type peroxidase [Natronomonas salina]
MSSRRSVLRRLGALGAAVSAGCASLVGSEPEAEPTVDLGENPNDLPARQHAWNAALATDGDGNPMTPRHSRVLALDLDAEPSLDAAETVERAVREVEAAYPWGADGLLHALAWGTGYFERLGELDASPIRSPKVLSRTDDPELLSFDAALVLASDVPAHLDRTEAAMFEGRDELAGRPVEHRLGDVFTVSSRRTGFMGDGLPAEHADAEGLPVDVPDDAPMFTGFFSGREKTQAPEDRVTIQDGRFTGGTTMHLSHIVETLDGWWQMSEDDRVAQMFSPEFDPADVEEFGKNVPFANAVEDHAGDHGVVGHHEKVARVREDGRPVILRRDFNTTDGGDPGVHFLTFQRSLDDFEKTRKSMNGWYLRDDHPQIRDRDNNGLLEFIEVRSRANFYVPPRERRSFPAFSE